MKIVSVPCRSDNYAYLLTETGRQSCVVVDPSQATPVLQAVAELGLDIAAIWNTHHHYDHVGGNTEILAKFPQAEVVAHASDKGRIPGQTVFVEDGAVISSGGIEAQVLFNPGHTSGAISFFLADPGVVFTGDTLFSAGCGRLFEGTAQQMYDSLCRLTALPKETKLYCGHEYTEANLRFAATVEPDNPAIAARLRTVLSQRAKGESTMGSAIGEELSTNVFVRVQEPAVHTAILKEGSLLADTPVERFAALRRLKDRS